MAIGQFFVFAAIGTLLLIAGMIHLRLTKENAETSLGISLMGIFGVTIFSGLTAHLA